MLSEPLDGAHRERESPEISLSEKLVSGLALAVLLGGFLCGAFTKRTGPSLPPVVSNASAKSTNYEIRTRLKLTAAISG
jgi:hypothetical protein